MLIEEIKKQIEILEKRIKEDQKLLMDYKFILTEETTKNRTLLAQKILQEVSLDYGIEQEGIIGRCRKKEFMEPRKEYARRLKLS